MAGPTTVYGQIYTLTLPSGNKVKVRRPSILSLVRTGQIPSNIMGAVWQTFGTPGGVTAQDLAKDPERVQSLVAMMEASITAILVQPKVSEEPSDVTIGPDGFTTGHVNVADIPDGDKNMLFGFVQGLIHGDEEEKAREEALRKFRAESASKTPGSPGETVQPQAESALANAAG